MGRRLAEFGRRILVAYPELPDRLASRLYALIRAGLVEADMRVSFGGIIFSLLFVFLPLAAAVNALIGGKPFLFWYYLSLLAALAYLNFAGETGRLRALNGVAAAYLGISLIVVIPIYVLSRSPTQPSTTSLPMAY